ncbi:MAG TPA: hypothetical protein H9990_07420 [Candidatus Parasutterella gallistercoris]|jgi:hypothetical protein|uniref:hypothetical protein n=1 Tax=Parasutterella TaxID=577310 RepID=UPI001F9303A6|nr:hypothetical protein [Parasutterella excrementihominis]HIV46002.1 hypothetical protein [Candidatus Parasutterella gallistercoris]
MTDRTKTLFGFAVCIEDLLTRILRVFPNGKFNPSPRVTDELSAGKTLSRLQQRPKNSSFIIPSSVGIIISLGIFFGSAVRSGSGAVFYSPSFSDCR